ncbi:MAG: adenylate/guanylate cyclase domain-containing protein [Planctomycetaceae bacterium]
MRDYATPEEEWHDFLSGTHPHLQERSPLRLLPSSPRCRLCKAPFRGPGAKLLKPYGFAPWAKYPKICGRCFKGLEGHAAMCPAPPGREDVRGAEIELSMLFADVRGSSKIARQMSVLEFTRLMDRFYKASSDELIEHDAIIEKFVGDEVVGLFIPLMTGPDHAIKAIEGARALFHAAGYGTPEGPWIPIGAGVHTGTAFVGMVGTHDAQDFTALGDPMNVAAHLTSQAAAGEILITGATADGASLETAALERRHLSLKGHPIDAFVLPVTPFPTTIR